MCICSGYGEWVCVVCVCLPATAEKDFWYLRAEVAGGCSHSMGALDLYGRAGEEESALLNTKPHLQQQICFLKDDIGENILTSTQKCKLGMEDHASSHSDVETGKWDFKAIFNQSKFYHNVQLHNTLF